MQAKKIIFNLASTVETTSFATPTLDSPPLISMYYLPYKNEEVKKLSSIEAIIAPKNGSYMEGDQHRGCSLWSWASN